MSTAPQAPPPTAAEMRELRRTGSKRVGPLRALVPFLKPYSGMLFLASVALLAAAGGTLVLPMAIRSVIDHGFSDRKSTRLNSSHSQQSRMPSSA